MSDDRTLALSQAYDLIEAGQPEAARAVIAPLVADDGPEVNNADAWWIYAHAVPDAATARAALGRVLALEPDYPGAADLLRTLDDQYPELSGAVLPPDLPLPEPTLSQPPVIPLPPDAPGEPDFIGRAATTPAAIPAAASGTVRRLDKTTEPPLSPPPPEAARKRNWIPIAIGAAALALVGVGVIALLNQTQTSDTTPGPETQVILNQTATSIIADATGTAQSAAGIASVPTDFPTLDAQTAVTLEVTAAPSVETAAVLPTLDTVAVTIAVTPLDTVPVVTEAAAPVVPAVTAAAPVETPSVEPTAAVTAEAAADDPAAALIGTATALAEQSAVVVTITPTDEAVTGLLLTATAVVEGATGTAAASDGSVVDPLVATATALVEDTSSAAAQPTEPPPLLLTATAIVAGATSTAAAEAGVIAATPTPESSVPTAQLPAAAPTEEVMVEVVTVEPTVEATPEVVVTDEATPEVVVTDEATPEVVVTDEATPEAVVTDEATPEVVVTDEATPEAVVTDEATPEVVVTDEATPESTPDPALGLDLEALTEVLANTVLPADAVRVETTELGETVIVSVCTLPGTQLRVDLDAALLEIGRQSAAITTGEAVAVELIDCETDEPLRLIAVTLEAAQRFARTGDELPFIVQWVSL